MNICGASFFFLSETLAVLFLLIEYLPSVTLMDVLSVGCEAVALVRRLWERVAFSCSFNWRGAGRRLLLFAQLEMILFTIYQTFFWLEKEMMNVGTKLKWLLISAFYNLISTVSLKRLLTPWFQLAATFYLHFFFLKKAHDEHVWMHLQLCICWLLWQFHFRAN